MERWRSVVLPILLLMIIAIGFWAYRGIELLEGKSAFAAKNYTVAARKLKPFSGWHDPVAQAELGYMTAHGLGLAENDAAAFALMNAAANTGLAYPEDQLGTMYAEGIGTAVDVTQAVFWWRQAALQGDANGETHLGDAYIAGQGVGQDYGQAATWFQQAADQADAEAQNDLGRLYKIGLGEPQDFSQAAGWFEKGSFLGDVDAQVNLGICYHEGSGVPRDDGKAAALFKPAAAIGNRVAQYYLGLDYLNGSGVPADASQAQKLFGQSAVQGFARAQETLGEVYARGEAGPGTQDAVLGYMLFDLAAGQGDAAARTAKTALASEMTPEQVAAGQALASQWSVNAKLPSTSFEDKAPQIVFGEQAPRTGFGAQAPGVYAASRVWFSRPFSLGGQNFYVVFLATREKPCHGCGAKISAATFRLQDGQAVARFAAPDFAQIGAAGDVSVADATAAPDSQGRIAAKVMALGGDNVAVLVPYAAAGVADYHAGDEVFSYRLKDAGDAGSGQWMDVGRIETGSEHTEGFAATGDCGADRKAAGGAASGVCVGWQGAMSVVPLAGSDWPEIDVMATGTVLEKKTPVPAPDEVYRFDGKLYKLVPQMAASGVAKG
jgi:TPR repeat protein